MSDVSSSLEPLPELLIKRKMHKRLWRSLVRKMTSKSCRFPEVEGCASLNCATGFLFVLLMLKEKSSSLPAKLLYVAFFLIQMRKQWRKKGKKRCSSEKCKATPQIR